MRNLAGVARGASPAPERRYGLGAPAWLAYAAIVIALIALVVGYSGWDRRQHPR